MNFRHSYVFTWLSIVFCIPILYISLNLVSKLDTHFFPVLQDMEAYIVHSDGLSVTYHVTGEKIRMCDFKEVRAYAKVDGYKVKLPIVNFVQDEGAPPTNRPTGLHDFGYWQFNLSILPNRPEYIEIFVEHTCGFPWSTITSLGKWET